MVKLKSKSVEGKSTEGSSVKVDFFSDASEVGKPLVKVVISNNRKLNRESVKLDLSYSMALELRDCLIEILTP